MRKTSVVLFLAAGMALAQDPLNVAGSYYKLIAENENVRLLAAALPPGAKTPLHSHPALLAVILQPGATKWTLADGKSVQSPPGQKRGAVVSMDAQTHVSENVGKTPLQVVLIEFKKPAPAAAKARKAVPPANCKPLADSPHATAVLCSGAPGSTVATHTHPNDVVYVALADLNAEITDSTGTKRTLEMKRNSASIAPPETHSGRNTGKTTYELIVVDLK
jgi:quercetin dioxygenase-like cupin family protein